MLTRRSTPRRVLNSISGQGSDAVIKVGASELETPSDVGSNQTFWAYYDQYFPEESANGNYGEALALYRETPAIPLPAALPLFASGLGVTGLLGWRRKRKARALGA